MSQYTVQLVQDHFYIGFSVEAENSEQALEIAGSIAIEEGLPEGFLYTNNVVVEVQ
jgi:hypothetical protein